MINGLDISNIQGNVDFVKVAASGIQFIILRCGVGNDGVDSDYVKNLQAAKAAGLKTACYHFVYPLPAKAGDSSRDPIAQATMHFNASCGEIAICDLEWPTQADWSKWGCTADQINEWTLAYLAEYSRLAGRNMMVYTYPDFAHSLNLPQDFAQYPLWIASYESSPTIPKPWADWVIWQTTGGGGKLPNGAPVDTDVVRDLSLWDPPVIIEPAEPPIVQPPLSVVTKSTQVLATPDNGSNLLITILNFISNLFKKH